MIDLSGIAFHALDRLGLNAYLFYPRKDYESRKSVSASGAVSEHVLIPVADGIAVGATFHTQETGRPNILFFHGNGEIVADYDEAADFFIESGVNFLPVDYRGYGRSNGEPSITDMMRDSHLIFSYVRNWLRERHFSGALIVMGRSLGSASALELLATYGDEINAVIIESGFARTETLLDLFRIDMASVGLTEEMGFRNLDKIRTFGKPTLIIHSEYDHLIPFSEAQALYDAGPAEYKKLLMIPGADHNDIFAVGLKEYMKAVKELAQKAEASVVDPLQC